MNARTTSLVLQPLDAYEFIISMAFTILEKKQQTHTQNITHAISGWLIHDCARRQAALSTPRRLQSKCSVRHQTPAADGVSMQATRGPPGQPTGGAHTFVTSFSSHAYVLNLLCIIYRFYIFIFIITSDKNILVLT